MAAGTYTVTSQATDQYDFSVAGNPVVGTVVYFTTGEGNRGSVFIPQTQYKVNNIKALVESHAKALDAVGAISGTYS